MRPYTQSPSRSALAQRTVKDAEARSPHPDKKRCAICQLYYKRVTAHVYQRHGLTAYEYKQQHGLPVSKGILTQEARTHLRALAYEQHAPENMKRAGKRTRYVKDDPRAHAKKPNAGRHFPSSDYF